MKYKLIKDSPVDTSDNGGHEKLAQSIATCLKENPTINSIAIYGKWGSGKSSVVKILKNKLKAKLIEYDVWTHTGEMLRRSFLGKLVEALELGDQKYNPTNSNEDTAKEILLKDIISGKFQSITTLNKTNTTKNPIQIIMVAFFISWVVTFIVVPEFIVYTEKATPFWNANWFFKSHSAGLLATLTIIFYCVLEKNSTIRDLLIKKTSLETTHEISQTTTLQSQDMPEEQFSKIYKDIILEEIKKQKNETQYYLICLDNIDRMGIENASAIIDELNGFISINQEIKNLCFVIPVDDDALYDVIKNHSNTTESNAKNENTVDAVDTFIHKLLGFIEF